MTLHPSRSSETRLGRAATDVKVTYSFGGFTTVAHGNRSAMIQDRELIEAIVNAVPEAHTSVVALIEQKLGHR